jgi:hypothetical protein
VRLCKNLSSPSDKKNQLASSGKSAAHFRTSRLGQEGRFAIVTNVEPKMRWTCHVAACASHADERHDADGEIVWSWHPGADAK